MDTPDELRERAARYRSMLAHVSDPRLTNALNSLADEYEALANRLEEDDLGQSLMPQGATSVSPREN